MRYLILSDIHANLQALEAVAAQAAGEFDQVLCCGDIVGYGADPNAVVEWVRRNVARIVRGNHDKACAGLEDPEWFNPVARHSALWTQGALSEENLRYLRNLPRGPIEVDGFQLLHGSPLDEDEYVLDRADANHLAPYLELPLSFFGHTHLQGGFWCHRNGVRPIRKPAPTEDEFSLEIEPDVLYLVNCGSVGQPRDHDPRAAYALFDSQARVVSLRRVCYDVSGAQERIRQEGLAPLLAERLAAGY